MAKEITKSAKVSNSPVAHGVGRRKTAVARIWLRRGNGQIRVNGQDYINYFDTKVAADVAATPFRVCPVGADFNVEVKSRKNVQVAGQFFCVAGSLQTF